MAEQAASIFNKKATEKLRSPDDLDKYVRVTSPRMWVVLVACVALLAGLVAWGVFGTVSTDVSVLGTVLDGKAVCFLSADNTSNVREGDAAYVGGVQMKVAEVGRVPLSREEARGLLGSDYLAESLVTSGWATQIVFEGDVSQLADGVPLQVSITTERVAPLSLIVG